MRKILVLSSLGVLVLTGLGLRYYALPQYRHHKEIHFVQQARGFMTKKDYRNASISAQQVRRLNPDNLDALRIGAELAEMSRSPQALDLRRRIAELEPTVENKTTVASLAMRIQGKPYPLATQTLEELREAGANVAVYHAVSAELALRLNQPDEAAAEFEAASRLDPTNDLHRLNLAVLRMRSTNESTAAQARQDLERLTVRPGASSFALRWLITESLSRNDLAGAQKFSGRLVSDTSPLEDRLQHLSILQKIGSPDFDAFLAGQKAAATTNASDIYQICRWMVAHGRAEDALKWLTNCPARIRSEQPAPLAMVDCLVAIKAWTDLEEFLQERKWDDREFLRLALLSRTAEELKQNLGVDSRWRGAVRAAEDRIGPLTMLLDLAAAWGREKAREDLLWVIAERCPRERWALQELHQIYDAERNTRGLNKVFTALSNADAKDFHVANDLAATSMLLKANLPSAHQLAKQMYQLHPEEAFIVSTYAYSLHLQGRSREGLAALEKLQTDALEQPPVALYYGLLLSATGQTNKAGRYLELAQKAQLLPEEKSLLAAASKAL